MWTATSNFQVRSTPVLVCKWRHSGHVGGQKQKHYFDANFTKKFLLYWPPTWPPCHVFANQEFTPGTIHEEPTPAGNVHWPKSLWAPVVTSVWIQKSMSNQWVINWLVIDYRRWSMCNRSMINRRQKILWPIDYSSMSSITHRCHWLFIDAIDYSLSTYWLLIVYSLIIMFHNFYNLLRISSIFLYSNYLSSPKSASWTVPAIPMIMTGKGELQWW